MQAGDVEAEVDMIVEPVQLLAALLVRQGHQGAPSRFQTPKFGPLELQVHPLELRPLLQASFLFLFGSRKCLDCPIALSTLRPGLAD